MGHAQSMFVEWMDGKKPKPKYFILQRKGVEIQKEEIAP